MTKNCSFFTILMCLVIPFFLIHEISATEPPIVGTMVQSRNILIAKGTSILENEVARIVKDTLKKRGFTIKTVHIMEVAAENPDSFRLTLFFNSMKSLELVEPAKEYLKNTKGSKKNVLICTVTGDLWNTTEPVADAITTATEDLWPSDVAGRILKSIYAIIGGP